MLRQLQATTDLLSDPHQVSIDLYFPFLVVEAKGMAAITSAENQAAVDGACSINVLRQLQRLVDRYLELFPTSDTPPTPPLFMFSITTECAHHDLWVHYYSKGDFHMTIIGSWPVSLRTHAAELVYALARIVAWGTREYCKDITDCLELIRPKE
jgi:hypothetical protein